MKFATAALVSVVLAAVAPTYHATSVPAIVQVINMLKAAKTKTETKSTEAAASHAEAEKRCLLEKKQLMLQINTDTDNKEALEAEIAKYNAITDELGTKVEDIAHDLTTDEKQLAAAKASRAKDAAQFKEDETKLTRNLGALKGAINVLTQAPDGESTGAEGSALLQADTPVRNVIHAITVMVQASMLSAADASRLTSLAQVTGQSDEDSDSDDGSSLFAPEGKDYKSKKAGLLKTLTDLEDTAEAELNKLHEKEEKAIFEYNSLRISLGEAVEVDEFGLLKTKKEKTETTEKEAAAEGDLGATKEDLKSETQAYGVVNHDCLAEMQMYAEEMQNRGEEIKALDAAIEALEKVTGTDCRDSMCMASCPDGSSPRQVPGNCCSCEGATTQGGSAAALLQTHSNATSFFQSKLTSHQVEFEGGDAVKFIRKLARKNDSPQLAMLASRIETELKLGGANGEDPFAKVKELIKQMAERLEAEAVAAEDKKGQCDQNYKKSNAEKEGLESDIRDLTATIKEKEASETETSALIAKTTKEKAENEESIAKLDAKRAADKVRHEGDLKEMITVIQGVGAAIKVLKEYYESADKNAESSDAVLKLLALVQSEYTKGKAEMITAEEEDVRLYNEQKRMMGQVTVAKTVTLKYKEQELTGIKKVISDKKKDLGLKENSLAAVTQTLEALDKDCKETAETVQERYDRRQAEIEGLKEALEILEAQTAATALMQVSVKKRGLRGLRLHQQ